MAAATSTTPLYEKDKRCVQELFGTCLYYARTIDSTMQTAVSSMAAVLITSDINDMYTQINHFLDYAATHSNTSLKYITSDMCLWAHSDASYLYKTKGRSQVGVYAYISSKSKAFPIHKDSAPPSHNGAVAIVCKVVGEVMSSAQGAKTGAGFLAAR